MSFSVAFVLPTLVFLTMWFVVCVYVVLAAMCNFFEFQVIALADVLKPESKEVVQYLIQKMKIEVWMCTGDNRRTASVVADQLGLDNNYVMVQPAVPSRFFFRCVLASHFGHLLAVIFLCMCHSRWGMGIG
jgi:hypothetical protein